MPTHPARTIAWLRRVAQEADRRDDGRLLDDFLSTREEAAFAELLRRHGPLVLGVCRRLLRDPHDVDDAFQATFVVLLRKARLIARREQLAGWLYGVAYRTAQKARFRRSRRAVVERQGVVADEPVRTVGETPEAAELLDRELLALPEKYRLPLVLCELRGLSRRDAARQLKLAEGTLSSRLARGRVLLRRRLERAGVALSAAGLLAALAADARANIPEPLFQQTLSGATAGPALGAGVRGLAEGVLTAMLLDKLKKSALAVLLFALVAGLGAWAAPQSPAAPPAPSSPAPGDRERLQGTWALTKIGDHDATPQERQAALGELIVRGDRLIDTIGGRVGAFTLDEKQNPRHLDWTAPAGPYSSEVVHRAWIYKLQGDTLTLCGQMSELADERPNEFRNAVIMRRHTIQVLTYQRKAGPTAKEVTPPCRSGAAHAHMKGCLACHDTEPQAAKPGIDPLRKLPYVGRLFEMPAAGDQTHLQTFQDGGTVLLGGLKKLNSYVIEPPDLLQITVDGDFPAKSAFEGQKVVRPDGTIALGGVYESVSLTGLTLEQAAEKIHQHLLKVTPTRDVRKVRVDVIAYNSKVYYLIVEQNGGEEVLRLPFTGRETVLDAMSALGDRLRKTPASSVSVKRGKETLLVDWAAVVLNSKSSTNLALQSGDRVYARLLPVAYDSGTPAASKPAEPQPFYVNTREFQIPISVDRQLLRNNEVLTLRVSTDRRTWQTYAQVPIDAKQFTFKADEDGEYWFGVTHSGDKTGPVAGLRVIVDTKPPMVVVKKWEQECRFRGVEWTITDANLDEQSLQVFVREQTNHDWQSLGVKPSAVGRTPLRSDTPHDAQLRVVVKDKAGNHTDLIVPVGDIARRGSGKIELLPPRPAADRGTWSKFGFRLAPVSATEVKATDSNLAGGLRVTDVKADSPAGKAGFKAGDILVGLHTFETVRLNNVLWLEDDQELKKLKSIKFYLIRDGKVHRGEMLLSD